MLGTEPTAVGVNVFAARGTALSAGLVEALGTEVWVIDAVQLALAPGVSAVALLGFSKDLLLDRGGEGDCESTGCGFGIVCSSSSQRIVLGRS